MNTKMKVRSILALLVAALVVLASAQVMAGGSSTATNERELTGVVTAITPTSVTIGGLVFNIAQAELNDTVTLGDVAKVHYSVAANGTLVARELELAVEVTPEATGVVDDHGQDDPANHPEDHHGVEPGDDRGQDNSVDDHHGDNRGSGNNNAGQEDHGGHQEDGGHQGGGHGGRG